MVAATNHYTKKSRTLHCQNVATFSQAAVLCTKCFPLHVPIGLWPITSPPASACRFDELSKSLVVLVPASFIAKHQRVLPRVHQQLEDLSPSHTNEHQDPKKRVHLWPRLSKLQHVPGSLGIFSSPFSSPTKTLSATRNHGGGPLTRLVRLSSMVVVAGASSSFGRSQSLGVEMVTGEIE